MVGPMSDLFLQAKQHVPELDLVIGRTNGFELELAIRGNVWTPRPGITVVRSAFPSGDRQ